AQGEYRPHPRRERKCVPVPAFERTSVNSLAIIGAGSWGTALSVVLAPRFDRIRLWAHEEDLAARMQSTRENNIFLSGLQLPSNVAPARGLAAALEGASIVPGVMPSKFARAV